jgi:hypothetical protein
MRNAVLLLLGLAIGAIATANVLSALRQRDAYARGLMNVLQHHYARLREDARRSRCTDASLRDLDAIRMLGDDIPQAVYGPDTPEAAFREYQQRLHDAAHAPAPCANVNALVERVGTACDACHRQYR